MISWAASLRDQESMTWHVPCTWKACSLRTQTEIKKIRLQVQCRLHTRSSDPFNVHSRYERCRSWSYRGLRRESEGAHEAMTLKWQKERRGRRRRRKKLGPISVRLSFEVEFWCFAKMLAAPSLRGIRTPPVTTGMLIAEFPKQREFSKFWSWFPFFLALDSCSVVVHRYKTKYLRKDKPTFRRMHRQEDFSIGTFRQK